MPISGITQPEIITIDDHLRLRQYTDDCLFALNWYQDEETLLLVDGITTPYDQDKLYRMYHYLEVRGLGKKVVLALIDRAKLLGFSYLEVAEIYDYNAGSRKLFEGAGFQVARKTEKGHGFRLEIK